MKIGLIDVDGHNFPNLPLMKLSAWYKQQGYQVEWYNHLQYWNVEPFDKVYMSKVFSFTPDYPYTPNGKEVFSSGTGYAINIHNGQEQYLSLLDEELTRDIEHTYPDYSLYGINDTAYGFLTRGCPRRCPFCHVGDKEGTVANKAADLSEFWRGEKEITLLDPNILACKESIDLLGQLAESKAYVDFSQGLDIRLMTEEKAKLLRQTKVKMVHFAWDNYEDKDIIVPKLQEFKEYTGWDKRKMGVFILTNFNTTIEQDLERVYLLRDLGYSPYVMIYNKQSVKKGSDLRRLQRWVNSRVAFAAVQNFKDFK